MLVQPSARALDLERQALASRLDHKQADYRTTAVLVQLADEERHKEFGYANFRDYAAARLDLTRDKAKELLRIGRALPKLPAVERAFAGGRLSWTKARGLLRVVSGDNEQAWVERACSVPNRVLEAELAVTLSGELPPDAAKLAKRPARSRLSVPMDTVDVDMVWAEIAASRAETGVTEDDLSDGEVLAALVRRGRSQGAQTSSHSPFTIVVEQCPTCDKAEGIDAELTARVVDRAACDSEVVNMHGANLGHVAQGVPPATRRRVLHRDQYRCRAPGCSNRLYYEVHHVKRRADGGGHADTNLLTICDLHHDLVHDDKGRLLVEADAEGFLFTFSDGRAVKVPFDPRKGAAPLSGPASVLPRGTRDAGLGREAKRGSSG